MASSTASRLANAAPRLLWAKTFRVVQASVWVQIVSLSFQNDVCRHPHAISTASSNTEATP